MKALRLQTSIHKHKTRVVTIVYPELTIILHVQTFLNLSPSEKHKLLSGVVSETTTTVKEP